MIAPNKLTLIQQMADTVRGLSIDAIQKANSGHPGLPLGCAEIGSMLYTQILKHHPAHPDWIDRDRFVLSAGHGSMFLYSLLGLCGYGTTVQDMAAFRQFGSKTPGHPEYGLTAGVETTTGPLGAGFATAVGMAMAETRLAAVFNTQGHQIINHFTYVLAGDGCMQEGVTSEAASLAAHLGLGKLIVFYDSNHITIEGHTDVSFTEDVGARFAAYGWQVLKVDGYDLTGIADAVAAAQAETGKPTLIVAKTVIGKGSPNKADSHEVHGAPLGADEVAATKKALGLDPNQAFQIPASVTAFVADRTLGWQDSYQAWVREFEAWGQAHPDLLALWNTTMKATTPHQSSVLPAVAWPTAAVGDKLATRAASGKCLQAAAAALPFLVGGSADLAPSNNTEMKGQGDYQKGNRRGRNLHFGIREHAMGSIINGLTLHGGVKAYGATFMVFSDYMRPSLRLAALTKIPSIFVLTHDSIWVGEDGPTHQPVEHLSSLRIIPGLESLRPADVEETTVAWELALSKGFGHHAPTAFGARKNAGEWHEAGPTTLVLTRQNLTVFAKPQGWRESVKKNGAYVALDAVRPQAVVLASGSEVGCALEAAAALKNDGKAVRVISVPSLDRFRAAYNRGDIAGQSAWIPAGVPVFAIEAADFQSWAEFVPRSHFVGVEGFGECGPGETVAQHFGVTAAGLRASVLARL